MQLPELKATFEAHRNTRWIAVDTANQISASALHIGRANRTVTNTLSTGITRTL